MVISDPSSPGRMEAFAFISKQPETAQLMIKTFSDTLVEMGIEPSGVDETTGEATYNVSDIAKAMGVPEDELGESMNESDQSTN